MPTMAEINEELIRKEGGRDAYIGFDGGWNGGVRDVTSGNHERYREGEEADIYADPPYYVGGFYHELHDANYYGGNTEYYEGWNEGKEAALAMKNGEKPVIEKSPEEIQYDRRMKCFTMAEKYAPRPAIQGGEKEPVGETIARAEVLMNYFYGGVTPGAPVKEGKKK